MMLGEMRLQGTMYRDNEPVLIGDPEGLREKIAAAAQKMPAGAMSPRSTPATLQTFPPVKWRALRMVPSSSRTASSTSAGRRGGAEHLRPIDHDRVTRLIGIRDLYNDLVGAQLGGEPG